MHHKLADVLSGYLWGGENTSGPNYATTALYLNSTKNAYYVYYKGSAPASLYTSALEDDNYYIFSTDFTQATVKIVANKVTIVNNAKVVGSNINGTAQTKGTQELMTDLGILSGRNNTAYVASSKHKIIWVKIYDLSGDLMHEFNFSEGAGSQTFDVITGNAYDISNINPADFWNYKQDFNHYNFRYGFTLYQKTGEADIRIPNKKDGSEIILPAPPTGYTRIANYKECRQTFNNCENVFVLDDVTVTEEHFTVSGGASEYDVNGDYYYYNDYAGKPQFKVVGKEVYLYYDGVKWCCYSFGVNQYVATAGNEATPDLAVWNTITVVKVEAGGSDVYDADVDRILFDTDGTAKEIEIQDIYSDVVNLTLDRGHLYINSDSDKNFMLYKTDKGVDTPEDLKIWAYVEK